MKTRSSARDRHRRSWRSFVGVLVTNGISFLQTMHGVENCQNSGGTFLGWQSADNSATRLWVTACPCEESRRPPGEGSTALVYEVAAPRGACPPPPAVPLWPREVGTWGLLQALQGGSPRAFERGLTRASRALGPRLLRLFTPPPDGPQSFWAAPTVLGGLALGSAHLEV